jgi:SAM-dependent methyltransferase
MSQWVASKHGTPQAEFALSWCSGGNRRAVLREVVGASGGFGPVAAYGAVEQVTLYAVDASPTLPRAFCERFPNVQTECAAAEESTYFNRTFDGVIAVGLIFLLPEAAQRIVLSKVANALKRGGRFLFTAPCQACSWVDEVTKRKSRSLGAEAYGALLCDLGFEVSSGRLDEGENHYFFAVKR